MNKKKSSLLRFTRITPFSNFLFNFLMIILCLVCIIPIVLVLAISFSAEESLKEFGYRLIPNTFSFDGYAYLYKQKDTILPALAVC